MDTRKKEKEPVDELEVAKRAVLSTSNLPVGIEQTVTGYDFNRGIHWEQLLDSFLHTGFQATHLGVAIQVFNKKSPTNHSSKFPRKSMKCLLSVRSLWSLSQVWTRSSPIPRKEHAVR